MVKVKVCGITNIGDALAAIEYGANALGFIFAPSPRQVTTSAVKDIVIKLPPFVCKVGVFVNSELDEVKETLSICSLDIAQLRYRKSRLLQCSFSESYQGFYRRQLTVKSGTGEVSSCGIHAG